MKQIRRTSPRSEIPTSSMADIAFLLIIFFMVTTVFSATKGLEVRLPTDDNIPPDPQPAVLIHVFDDDVLVDCRPMEAKDILPYLQPRLTRNPNKPVILYADSEAEYQDVITIYDLLAGSGTPGSRWQFTVDNVSIPTASEIDDYVELFGVNPMEVHCQ